MTLNPWIASALLVLVPWPAFASGHLDDVFGEHGVATVLLPEGTAGLALDGMIDTQGRPVMVGNGGAMLEQSIGFVARWTASGDADVAMNAGHPLIFASSVDGENSFWNVVAATKLGGFVAAGADGKAIRVCEFLQDGQLRSSPDGGFGDGGCARIDLPPQRSGQLPRSLAIDQAGRVVLAVLEQSKEPQTPFQYSVYRFTPDGENDTSFGDLACANCGHVTSPDWLGGKFLVATMVLDPVSARILLAGGRVDYRTMYVLALRADGAVDVDYGAGGVRVVNFASLVGQDADATATDGAILPDGSLVLVGTGSGSQINANALAAAKLTAAGDLDGSFGVGGRGIYVQGMSGIDGYQGYFRSPALTVQSDGKIVVATGLKNASSIAVTRLRNTGPPDEKFGKNGVSMVDVQTDLLIPTRVVAHAGQLYIFGGAAGPQDGAPVVIRLDQDLVFRDGFEQ